MLWGADIFVKLCREFRSVMFEGRYGSGKTLAAVVLARELKRRYGYEIFSNVHGDQMLYAGEAELPKKHAVIVYDEAWLSMGAGTSPQKLLAYLAFLRKQDYVLFSPSVLDLAKGAYQIATFRHFNFGIFGLPLWWYQWHPKGKSVKQAGGSWFMWLPQRYFGTYDTLGQPDVMKGIFDGIR